MSQKTKHEIELCKSQQKQQTMTISESIMFPVTIFVFNIRKSHNLFVVSNRESMATLVVNLFSHLMKAITSVSTKRKKEQRISNINSRRLWFQVSCGSF